MMTISSPLPYPEFGALKEVGDGIIWLSIPLPLDLKHVNCWLIEEGGGVTVVDCGPDTGDCLDIWNKLIKNDLLPAQPSRLVITHGHGDHCGISGWLASRFDVPIYSTLSEWQSARLRHHVGVDALLERGFMEGHGVPAGLADASCRLRAVNSKLMGPQPAAIRRLRDGDEIAMGGRSWRVIAGGGHTDEHACFYDPANGILIAGDQVLPEITPLIAVYGDQSEANPLADYLATLSRLRELPENVLVLPSHGRPFTGLHVRIEQLIAHHERRLDELRVALDRPRTGFELSAVLFPKAYDTHSAWLALAETIAHLNFLISRGEARYLDGSRNRVVAAG